MAINRFIPLHSSQSGAIPTASGLFPGELAINTADGKLYSRHENQVIALNDTTNFVSSSQQVINHINGQIITPLSVLAESFTGSFTGSFFGDGSNLNFTTLNTNQTTDSQLVVGNIYNNYQNRQKTIFKKGDLEISGSVTISNEGFLILTPRSAPIPAIAGGFFYSSSGEFFVGTPL